MGGVSAEQVALAKEVDLLSYLQASEPQELKKSGAHEYRMVSNGSLVISRGLWYWNRGGFGGRTALDYLIKVRGMDFVDAVETVLAIRAAPVFSLLVEKAPPPDKKLFLPKPLSIPTNAVKYLSERGIHSKVISFCLKSGIFYEGIYKNPKEPEYDNINVCVFVGRSENGQDCFAALRGITTDLKKDVAGSDKRFGFMISANKRNNCALAVFESPVDLLSHVMLALRGDLEFDGHRLSLSGTSDVALLAFLERNPHITNVSLCLDNDKAGQMASEKIQAKLASTEHFAHIVVTTNLPRYGKDYNDVLLHSIRLEREHRPQSRDSFMLS